MVDRFGGRGSNNGGPNWNAIFNMSDISEKTQAHLSRVYLTLLSCVGSCVLGMYTNSTLIITGMIL